MSAHTCLLLLLLLGHCLPQACQLPCLPSPLLLLVLKGLLQLLPLLLQGLGLLLVLEVRPLLPLLTLELGLLLLLQGLLPAATGPAAQLLQLLGEGYQLLKVDLAPDLLA